jgi:hypothetical protein
VAADGSWRQGGGGSRTGGNNKRREKAIRHFCRQSERVSAVSDPPPGGEGDDSDKYYGIGGGDHTEDFGEGFFIFDRERMRAPRETGAPPRGQANKRRGHGIGGEGAKDFAEDLSPGNHM